VGRALARTLRSHAFGTALHSAGPTAGQTFSRALPALAVARAWRCSGRSRLRDHGPAVFGWLHFEAEGQTHYRPMLSGCLVRARIDGVLAWFVFHGLTLADVAVAPGPPTSS
jgi:hypothetical protein